MFNYCIYLYSYIRHGSYPLVTPYNETYPENFHIDDSHHLKLTTNNVTLPYSIKMPKSGSWFLGGFLPRAQKQYLQAVIEIITFVKLLTIAKHAIIYLKTNE